MQNDIAVSVEIKKAEARLIHWREVAQSWFHSRKAMIYLVVFVLINVAFFLKRINGDQWIDALKWSTVGYMGANAISGVATAITGKDNQ